MAKRRGKAAGLLTVGESLHNCCVRLEKVTVAGPRTKMEICHGEKLRFYS
jgi:hypothetical protein